MSVTLLQGLILALIVFAFAWDARWECFFVFHPIIVCFVTGLVLGDWKLGLEAGAIAELSYLGLTTVGGTVPPNALIAGLMTVVLAYKSGVSAETALGLSLPFALLMQWIVIACQSLFSGFNVKVEQAIKQNDIKSVKIARMEVPCCGGLENAVKKALLDSGKFIPWTVVTVSTDGNILD